MHLTIYYGLKPRQNQSLHCVIFYSDQSDRYLSEKELSFKWGVF